MDTTNRRPQLPALSYLDIDKQKREEDTHQGRNAAEAQLHTSAPSASPVSQYPSGPPPPYSHSAPQHANSWGSLKSSAHTPPESRRASGDDNENIKQGVRQSLPSISEALGVESQTSYPPSLPTSHPSSQSTHLSHSQPVAPLSPSSATRRTYAMEPPHQPTFGNTQSYSLSSFRQDSAGPQQYSQPDVKPSYAIQSEVRPPLHVQTSQAPQREQPSGMPSHQPSTSTNYEQSSSHSAGSMGPPSFPYGYTPYPPRYAQPAPPSHTSGPIYQPSTQYAAPPTPTSWKSESAPTRYDVDDRAPAQSPYSESVKRHLDLFDLGAALEEIAKTSGIMTDFSRRYGDRLHQTARSAPSLSTLPSIVEVEDMISKSRIQMESLAKIREVILAQQAAYEQQLVDQRQQQQQHKVFAEPPSQPHENHLEGDDSMEFGGSDAKKPRRGRAAPPGRCHSCNRAETPEWRRGPDGARTLCNACGLHYAKLTRKQTGANKNTNVGSSNLRPKES